jgi:hypothetical protein
MIALHSRVLVPNSLVDASPEVVWEAVDHAIHAARTELRSKGGRLVGGITISVQSSFEVDMTEVRLDCYAEGVAT